MTGAIAANVWHAFERDGKSAFEVANMDFLLLGCEGGRVGVTRVAGSLLLCLYARNTVEYGLLKAKVGPVSFLCGADKRCFVAFDAALRDIGYTHDRDARITFCGMVVRWWRWEMEVCNGERRRNFAGITHILCKTKAARSDAMHEHAQRLWAHLVVPDARVASIARPYGRN